MALELIWNVKLVGSKFQSSSNPCETYKQLINRVLTAHVSKFHHFAVFTTLMG